MIWWIIGITIALWLVIFFLWKMITNHAEHIVKMSEIASTKSLIVDWAGWESKPTINNEE